MRSYAVLNECSFFEAGVAGVSLKGYLHDGLFFYNLTSGNVTNDDVIGAYIVDGKPERSFEKVVELDGPYPPNSTDFLGEVDGSVPSPPVYAYFSREDVEKVNKDILNLGAEGVYDIFRHVCMGHIFLLIETRDANLSAPIMKSLTEEDIAQGMDSKTACEAYMANYMPAQAPMASMDHGSDEEHAHSDMEDMGAGEGASSIASISSAVALVVAITNVFMSML